MYELPPTIVLLWNNTDHKTQDEARESQRNSTLNQGNKDIELTFTDLANHEPDHLHQAWQILPLQKSFPARAKMTLAAIPLSAHRNRYKPMAQTNQPKYPSPHNNKKKIP